MTSAEAGIAADLLGYLDQRGGAAYRPLPRALGRIELIAGAVAFAFILRAVARIRR